MVWTEAWSATDPALSYTGGIGHSTLVCSYPAAQLADADPNGVVVRITVIEDSYAVDITSMYIGLKAGTGNAYDFADTPTAVLFNGVADLSLGSTLDTEHVSDEITFAYTGTDDILISWHKEASANNPLPRFADPNIPLYYKINVDEASVIDKTGFASWDANRSYFIKKIEYNTVASGASSGGFRPFGGTPFGGSNEGFDGNKWSY